MPHHLPPVKGSELSSPLAHQRALKKFPPKAPHEPKTFHAVMHQYDEQVSGLQQANVQLRTNVSVAEQSLRAVMEENDQLRSKLEHLEHVFVNNQVQTADFGNAEYSIQLKTEECNRLRAIIDELDRERHLMMQKIDQLEQHQTGDPTMVQQLQDRIAFLQTRERDLMKALVSTVLLWLFYIQDVTIDHRGSHEVIVGVHSVELRFSLWDEQTLVAVRDKGTRWSDRSLPSVSHTPHNT